MKIYNARVWIMLLLLSFLAGCASSPHAKVFEQSSAVQLRSYQSRVFNTTDRHKTLRTVIAALQDLGFVVDKADAVIGTVTATKLDGYELRVTVTVRPRGETQTLVRANATFANEAIEEPGPYQDFYVVLEKAMFLTAHQID
jgi:hypothetical protein